MTSCWIESTESHVILGGGVAVCLLLSAHRAVIFAIAQLSCLVRYPTSEMYSIWTDFAGRQNQTTTTALWNGRLAVSVWSDWLCLCVDSLCFSVGRRERSCVCTAPTRVAVTSSEPWYSLVPAHLPQPRRQTRRRSARHAQPTHRKSLTRSSSTRRIAWPNNNNNNNNNNRFIPSLELEDFVRAKFFCLRVLADGKDAAWSSQRLPAPVSVPWSGPHGGQVLRVLKPGAPGPAIWGAQLVGVGIFYVCCRLSMKLVKSRLLQQLSSTRTIFKSMLKLLRLLLSYYSWAHHLGLFIIYLVTSLCVTRCF